MVRPASTGTARREVRLNDRAATGWVDADVHTAFLESLQCLAVAERKHHIQACAFLHLGKVQHGIDQARAAVRGMCPDSARNDAQPSAPVYARCAQRQRA